MKYINNMDEESEEKYIVESLVKYQYKGLTEACFDKCITKYEASLTQSNKVCLAMCQDRYQEAFSSTFLRIYEKVVKGMREAINISED
ncbi:unnamed protein product [Blepharisma stoltei]|uniref:Mitochondrial import inner membrane translocase subunit n=1 Tax=Blepharisma stoltei TaxID=1481888 RepID=A0AAU9K362_9CILI|nr:unnamed protein product [Blepharisma stoltei]